MMFLTYNEKFDRNMKMLDLYDSQKFTCKQIAEKFHVTYMAAW
jgi:hypothetical protein